MSTEILRPNADGDVIELFNQPNANQINNWDAVNDIVPDEANTDIYNYDYQTPQIDLYNLPAHSGSGTISKITVYARISANSADGDYARIAIKTGGTVYYSGNLTTTGYGFEDKSYEWTINPQTTNAWIWDDIEALQAGIELIYNGSGALCTQLYVEVEYTEVTTVVKDPIQPGIIAFPR
jgi:hypothetical protein